MCENCENPLVQYVLKNCMRDASINARNKVIQQYYENIFRMELELGRAPKELIELHNKQKALKDEISLKNDTQLPPIMFVTINPRFDVEVDDLKEIMSKLVRKKWIEKYIYVFEQRGENANDIKGAHIHLMLYRNGKRASQVIREISNTIKHITNINDDRIFNIRFVKEDDQNVARCLNYITGKKADEDKHQKQEIDKIFREKYGLKDYYQKGFI